MDTYATLREPSVDDVCNALSGDGFSGWPQDEDELLRFFKAMLGTLLMDSLGNSISVPFSHFKR